MTTLSTLVANNAGFGNVVKTIQSGGAYIDPKGRVLSTTQLKPLPTYYGAGAVFTVRDQAYSYDENGSLIPVPREPLEIYKFDVAGDGKFAVPKLRNEKDGGYYKDVTLNATKDGGNFTLEDKDTTATGQYFKTTKGTDFSNQQWVGMSRGLANISNATQTGEATVDSKKSKQIWDDGSGNQGSREYYALRDGNGTEVGQLFDVPGRPDLKYADVGNETAGGGHYVYLQVDPKSGAVAPIQDFSKQVTYRESQGKNFWSLVSENAKSAAPVFAMIFAPAAGQAIGAALMEAGVVTSASAAAAGAATAAEAATAAAAANATATAIGTGIANATTGILQGKPVDQAIGDAAISTAIQLGTPGALGEIKSQIANITSNPAISNIVTNATMAAGTSLLKGKNALEAFEKGGTNALINQIGLEIPGFADMNATAKKVLTDSINAGISGKDFKLTPEYMVNTLISTANKTAKNTQTANEKFEDVFGRPATEEELKRFATVETEEELNQSFNSYITEANEASAKKEGWDSLDQKNEAWNAGYRNPDQYDTYLVDKKADEDAVKEGWTSADQKYDASVFGYKNPEEYKNFLAEQASQRELALAKDNEKNPFTGTAPGTVVKEKGPENYSKDFGGTGGDTDYIPPWMDSSLTGATKDTADVVDTLVKSGLEDGSKDVDLNKVVAGADTVTGGNGADTLTGGGGTDEDADQAKRVADFGKDLTGGGVQDLGVEDIDTDFYNEDSTGMGAYKYDPTSGTYTYTSDDGSTLTLDADGNIVGFTETTDTSWTGLTDTATGNLNLPKLPGGKLPAVKPPAKKVTTTKPTSTTTTTGVGNTAITTGSNTAVQTGGGLNIAALMAIMGGLGGNQQPQQPQIETYDPGKGFEYFDWESDPFAPKTKDKTNPTGQPKMAGGGSVDELLEILRRSGI